MEWWSALLLAFISLAMSLSIRAPGSLKPMALT
jgi:hypothetical protein